MLHWWHPPRRARHAHALRRRPAVAALRWPRPTSRATGDAGVLDEVAPFLTRPRAGSRARTRCSSRRRSAGEPPTSTSTAAAPSTARSTRRRARPAADRHRRLERRHEPRRPRGPRRERVDGLLPATACSTDFMPARASARGDDARAARYRAAPRAPGGRARRRRLGRRVVPARLLRRRHAARLRRRATSAASTRSRRRGRCSSGAAPPERADAGDATRSRRTSIDDDAGLIRLLDAAVRSTRRTTPATSRATCRASARTAASTRTRRCGSCARSPSCGRRDRAARLLEMLSPVQPRRRRRRRSRVYQVEPYVVAADVYGAAPHVGRGGWTWYTGSAGLDVARRARVGARRDASRAATRWSSGRAFPTPGRASRCAAACPTGRPT